MSDTEQGSSAADILQVGVSAMVADATEYIKKALPSSVGRAHDITLLAKCITGKADAQRRLELLIAMMQ